MKKYRWNKRVFLHNVGTLLFRFMAVTVFIFFTAIGPIGWYGL